jgi:hypothetical protein
MLSQRTSTESATIPYEKIMLQPLTLPRPQSYDKVGSNSPTCMTNVIAVRSVPLAIGPRLIGHSSLLAKTGSKLSRNAIRNPDMKPLQRDPPSIQDVGPEPPRYEWLWLKMKRIFAKASWNVLRQQVRAVRLPSWTSNCLRGRSNVSL